VTSLHVKYRQLLGFCSCHVAGVVGGYFQVVWFDVPCSPCAEL